MTSSSPIDLRVDDLGVYLETTQQHGLTMLVARSTFKTIREACAAREDTQREHAKIFTKHAKDGSPLLK